MTDLYFPIITGMQSGEMYVVDRVVSFDIDRIIDRSIKIFGRASNEVNTLVEIKSKTDLLNKSYLNVNDIFDEIVIPVSSQNDLSLNKVIILLLPEKINVTNNEGLSDKAIAQSIRALFQKLNSLYKSNKLNIDIIQVGHSNDDLIVFRKNIKKFIKLIQALKNTFKFQIICSDKIIGIPIDELNQKERNPLKIYQTFPLEHPDELLLFLDHAVRRLRWALTGVTDNGVNSLLSFAHNLVNELIGFKSLKRIPLGKFEEHDHFLKYFRKTRISHDHFDIYYFVKDLFSQNLISRGYNLNSINVARLFELRCLYGLSGLHGEKLLYGNENTKTFQRVDITQDKEFHFSDINSEDLLYDLYLLAASHEGQSDREFRQFPDFLIEIEDEAYKGYQILDAKYKSHVLANDIRQIIVYNLLFNKGNEEKRDSCLVYPQELVFDVSEEISCIELDTSSLNLTACSLDVIEDKITNTSIYICEVPLFIFQEIPN